MPICSLIFLANVAFRKNIYFDYITPDGMICLPLVFVSAAIGLFYSTGVSNNITNDSVL